MKTLNIAKSNYLLNEYKKHLNSLNISKDKKQKILKKIKKDIKPNIVEAEKYLKKLFSNFKIKTDKRIKNTLYYCIGNKIYAHLNNSNLLNHQHDFYLNVEIYHILEEKYKLTEKEIDETITYMVEKYFRLYTSITTNYKNEKEYQLEVKRTSKIKKIRCISPFIHPDTYNPEFILWCKNQKSLINRMN